MPGGRQALCGSRGVGRFSRNPQLSIIVVPRTTYLR